MLKGPVMEKEMEKGMEKGMASEGEQYRTKEILDIAKVMIIVISADQTVGMINREGCRILGYDESEIVGKNWFDNFLPEGLREKVRRFFIKMIHGEIVPDEEPYENPILRKDGEERLILWNNTVLRDGEGKIRATLSSGQDVTQMKASETHLQERSDLMEKVFEDASDGIFLLDDQPNYVLINPASGRIIGLEPKDWVGKRAGMAVHPEDVEKTMFQFFKTLGGEATRFEARLKGSGERYRILDIRLTPLRWKGKDHILGMVTDISERARLEELQRERARSEVYGFLAAALPVFATNVPENVRSMLVSTFAERFEKNMRPRMSRDIDVILKARAEEGAREGGEGGDAAIVTGPKERFEAYFSWIRDYFSNMGIQVGTETIEGTAVLDLGSCPWIGRGRGNPIFCSICRTMVLSSFSWMDIDGDAVQASSIANGDDRCRFEFTISKRKR